MIVPIGPLVNAAAVIGGGVIGMLLGARLPERVRQIVFQGLGLCVLLLGIQSALKTGNPLILIFSVLTGSIAGELLHLENGIESLGNKLKTRLKSSNPRFTEGFVTGSVIFCIGAMAILGSIEEGLQGERNIVYTKSILDGFASIALASAMGLGVACASIAVFVYQGALLFGASMLQSMLTPTMINELSATGGILIMGIGLNLLELVRIPLANMLPSLVVVVILVSVFM